MNWYSAALIYVIRVRDSSQDDFPIWENVCLIEAEDDDAAFLRAEAVGREREIDDPSLFLDDKPAKMSFYGVRKLFLVDAPFDAPEGSDPKHGSEVAFSRYSVSSQDDLNKLMCGDCVQILFEG